jgi:hypothetical protein
LTAVGVAELEEPGSGALSMIRAAGGAGLAAPVAAGGLGLGVRELAAAQRELATHAPSAAYALGGHHAAVAALAFLAEAPVGDSEVAPTATRAGALLADVARHRWLLGGPLGGIGGGPAEPSTTSVVATPAAPGSGACLRGLVPRCGLTWSMDLLVATAVLPTGRSVLAVLSAAHDGVRRERSPGPAALARLGERDRVVLVDVPALLLAGASPDDELDVALRRGAAVAAVLRAAVHVGLVAALAAADGAAAHAVADLDARLEELAGAADDAPASELATSARRLTRAASRAGAPLLAGAPPALAAAAGVLALEAAATSPSRIAVPRTTHDHEEAELAHVDVPRHRPVRCAARAHLDRGAPRRFR